MKTLTPIMPSKARGPLALHHRDTDTETLPAEAELSAEDRVRQIVREADEWRKGRQMTLSAFIARFQSYFGSQKTFTLLRDKPAGQWERRSPERWLERLRGLSAALADEDRRGTDSALIELPQTALFASALRALRSQRGLRRVLLIEGGTGSGKTSLLDMAEARLGEGRKIVRIRGRQAWDSLHEMLADFLLAMGEKQPGPTTARRQSECEAALAAMGDAIVLIDEAQYLTGRGINCIKDWVNAMAERGNAVHFVLAAMDTLWRKLSEASGDEARQLRINRTLDRLTLTPPDAGEVEDLLSVTLDLAAWSDKERREVCQALSTASASCGLRAFVRDVREAAAEMDGEAPSPAAVKAVAEAISAKNRTRR